MVRRAYPLLGIIGLLFMGVGLLTTYNALGQEDLPPTEVTAEGPPPVEIQPTTAPPADAPPAVDMQPTTVPPVVDVQPTTVPPVVDVQPTTLPPTDVPPQPTTIPPTLVEIVASPTPVLGVVAAEVVADASPTFAPQADASADVHNQRGDALGQLQRLFRQVDWAQVRFTLALPDGRVITAAAAEFDPQTLAGAPAGRYVLDVTLPDGRTEHFEFDLQGGQIRALIAMFPAGRGPAPVAPAATATPLPPVAQVPAVVVPATATMTQVPPAAQQPVVVVPGVATATLPPPTAIADAAAAVNAAPAAQVSGMISGVAIQLRLVREDGLTFDMQPDASGQFHLAQLPAGVYYLEAFAPGHLPARISFGLAQGQALAVPPTALIAGDANGDGLIDVQDAALIAANFDGPAHIPAADLDQDGWIDVRDLSLVGRHFGMTGPTAWGQP